MGEKEYEGMMADASSGRESAVAARLDWLNWHAGRVL